LSSFPFDPISYLDTCHLSSFVYSCTCPSLLDPDPYYLLWVILSICVAFQCIIKDIIAACKLKSCEILRAWIPSLKNMIWWCMRNSGGECANQHIILPVNSFTGIDYHFFDLIYFFLLFFFCAISVRFTPKCHGSATPVEIL
jgi:hypothetical protein